MKYTDNYDKLFWAYNLPVQLWTNDEGEVKCLIYMPRKERCVMLDEPIGKDELKTLCKNTAEKLRDLAIQFDKFEDIEDGCIYYP